MLCLHRTLAACCLFSLGDGGWEGLLEVEIVDGGCGGGESRLGLGGLIQSVR